LNNNQNSENTKKMEYLCTNQNAIGGGPGNSDSDNAEREVIVNGTHIRVKSVFNGNIPLEKALGNLVQRKISDKKAS